MGYRLLWAKNYDATSYRHRYGETGQNALEYSFWDLSKDYYSDSTNINDNLRSVRMARNACVNPFRVGEEIEGVAATSGCGEPPPPPPSSCTDPSSNQVTLYDRPGFDANGQCVTKGIGQYANPGAIGLPNDSIRSVKVGSNVKLTLCENDNFLGTCRTYESDNGDITGNVGNGPSSAKVENRPNPLPAIMLRYMSMQDIAGRSTAGKTRSHSKTSSIT